MICASVMCIHIPTRCASRHIHLERKATLNSLGTRYVKVLLTDRTTSNAWLSMMALMPELDPKWRVQDSQCHCALPMSRM